MAEERVDRESGAEEIVGRESFNEEGPVEDIFGNCPPMSLLQPEMQRMKLRNHESVTAKLSRLLTKTRCVTGRTTRMQSKCLRKSGKRLCGDLCQRASPKAKATLRHSRIQDRCCPQTIWRMRDQPGDAASVASRHAPSISTVSNICGPSSPIRIML
jgi:hypothetical protein